MKQENQASRPIGTSASAATMMIALLAMTLAVAQAPGATHPGHEGRATSREARAVRAVAEAVAAVARDFLGGVRLQSANPVAWRTNEVETPGVALVGHQSRPALPGHLRLGERLLDLPPPIC